MLVAIHTALSLYTLQDNNFKSMALFIDRVIAITGGASGIGLSTAHLLASRHAALALADINSTTLSAAKQSLLEAYPSLNIHVFVVDVSSESSVSSWLDAVQAHFGHIDGAVNLAGIIPRTIGLSGVDVQDLDDWNRVIGVNLTGTMLCMKYQLRLMSDHGSIVNASSIGGVQGLPFNAAYSASKHGVIGLTRSVAKEVGKTRGIRVNAVCPGFIETPMQAESKEIQLSKEGGDKERMEEEREKRIKSVALGRGGRAEEVGELICYLLGRGSSFVTGTAVSVDGGWNC